MYTAHGGQTQRTTRSLTSRLRQGCLVAAGLLALAGTVHAVDPALTANPVTIKEISDSLHNGVPNTDLVTAVTSRHLLESPKAAEEAELRTAGATPRLIDVIKSGTFTLSPFEANSVRKRLAEAAAAPAGAPAALGHVASLLRGKLVTWQAGSLQNYSDARLAGKKYFALYYSAEWCGPCRRFTPRLVQFYQRVAALHPEMEVVFVSNDRSAADMQKYMQTDKMPWPAIRFDALPNEKELLRYRGNGIPCLVVVDEAGKVVADSFAGTDYLGPTKPANELAKLLGVPPMPPST